MEYIIGVVAAILWFAITFLFLGKPKAKKAWTTISTVGIIITYRVFPTVGLMIAATMVAIILIFLGIIYISSGKEEFKEILQGCLTAAKDTIEDKKESKEAA